jgi:hypothetical protein
MEPYDPMIATLEQLIALMEANMIVWQEERKANQAKADVDQEEMKQEI